MYLVHKHKKIMITFFCFKQLPLLSVVVGVVRFSADKTLDFHDTPFSVIPGLFKV